MTHSTRTKRKLGYTIAATVAAGALITSAFAPAALADSPSYPSDSHTPDLISLLGGYNDLWASSGKNDLHGTVLDQSTLEHNDQLTSWINQNATSSQQFRALQNSAYKGSDGSGYDQSISIADGLGKRLGEYYAKGRVTGKLPKVDALINSSDGTTGAYVGTGSAKKFFSYPRPFLPVSPSATAPAGDEAACAPSAVNGSSLADMRKGKEWADANGNLKITRVNPTTDTTKAFANTDVKLNPAYREKGICTGGSFPSGHTTTAYQAGLTLATLLPELAPSILARTSEAGNNRIVLGVHYPLDIMGGRMNGEASLSARWSDKKFRTNVLEPARRELVGYLKSQCKTASLKACIDKDKPYTDNPYGGKVIPGGTSQIVTNKASSIKVYTERLTYGFKQTGDKTLDPSVPTGAENLLLTSYPTLNSSQRRQILAQTELPSGYPLDTTDAAQYGSAPGSWQRLNLAKAMTAKVKVYEGGSVKVIGTGVTPAISYSNAAQRKVAVHVNAVKKSLKKGKRPEFKIAVKTAKQSGVVVAGKVSVSLGKQKRTVKLVNGKGSVKFAKAKRVKKYTLKVNYAGNGYFKSAKKTIKVSIKRK